MTGNVWRVGAAVNGRRQFFFAFDFADL